MGSLSCVSSILLSVAALPEKASCLVVASCVSFVSPQAAKLTRSAAPPLPTKPCDFAGTPTMAACSGVGTLPGLRDILGLLTKWFSKKSVLKKVQEKVISAIKTAKTG